jgi:hypothetical protein
MAKSSKGSQYERDTCKQLSLWYTQDEKKPHSDVFWRTSQSGGRATTRAKKGKKTAYAYGDVTFTDPIGQPFISKCLLELKRGYTKDISILDFLDKNKGEPILLKWWNKSEKERRLAKRKYILIIFRRDRHKSCILMKGTLFGKMQDMFGAFNNNILHIKYKNLKLVAIELDKFLDWCHPDFFKRGK